MQSIIIVTLSLVSSSPAPQGLGLLSSLSSGSTSDITSGNNGLSSGLASGSTSDLASSAGQSSKFKGIETGFGLGSDSFQSSNSQNTGALSGLLGQKRTSNLRGTGSGFGSSNTALGISQLGLNSGNPSQIRKGSRHRRLRNRLARRPHGFEFDSFEPVNEQPHHSLHHRSRKNTFEPCQEDSGDEEFSEDERDYYFNGQSNPSNNQCEEIYMVEGY